MKQGILISGSLMAVLLGVGAVSVSPSATAQQLPPPQPSQPRWKSAMNSSIGLSEPTSPFR